MGFYDGFADSQSQAGPFGFVDAGRRQRGEFVEDGLEVFRRDSNTLVPDGYDYMRPVFFKVDPNFRVRSGKFNGIFDQIDQNLLDARASGTAAPASRTPE